MSENVQTTYSLQSEVYMWLVTSHLVLENLVCLFRALWATNSKQSKKNAQYFVSSIYITTQTHVSAPQVTIIEP